MPTPAHPVVVRIDTTDLQRLLRELQMVLVAIQEERRKFKQMLDQSRQGG